MSLAFVALGTPVQQGNHRVNQHGAVYETSKGHGPWRDTVAWSARAAMPRGWVPLEGPLSAIVWFSLPRPKSAPKKIELPAKKPDLDKLVRGVFDACTTAGVWHDDSQVFSLSAGKCFAADMSYDGHQHRWTAGLDVPGVVVVVSTLHLNLWRDAERVAAKHCRCGTRGDPLRAPVVEKTT